MGLPDWRCRTSHFAAAPHGRPACVAASTTSILCGKLSSVPELFTQSDSVPTARWAYPTGVVAARLSRLRHWPQAWVHRHSRLYAPTAARCQGAPTPWWVHALRRRGRRRLPGWLAVGHRRLAKANRPAKAERWVHTMATGHAPRFCGAKSARPQAASAA